MLPFDPIELRDLWLQVRLQYTINCKLGLTPISHLSYATILTSSFVDGYLVGLSEELKAAIEKHVIWMESEPEPDRARLFRMRDMRKKSGETLYTSGDRHLGCASGSVEAIAHSTI